VTLDAAADVLFGDWIDDVLLGYPTASLKHRGSILDDFAAAFVQLASTLEQILARFKEGLATAFGLAREPISRTFSRFGCKQESHPRTQYGAAKKPNEYVVAVTVHFSCSAPILFSTRECGLIRLNFYLVTVSTECEQAALIRPENKCIVFRQAFENIGVRVVELIQITVRYKCEAGLQLVQEIL
jgi:hypothetical protein